MLPIGVATKYSFPLASVIRTASVTQGTFVPTTPLQRVRLKQWGVSVKEEQQNQKDIELNTSRRAPRELEHAGIVDPHYLTGEKNVLDAAALTYVAAAMAASELLRLLVLKSSRD
jgi:hypothetical protein